MGPETRSLQMYRELADWYERLGQTTMRDRFLMLAADAALQIDQPDEAERLRMKLLAGSRHHMLRPYASWTEASTAPDVQAYLRDLRLNYPPEVAEQMLVSLKEPGGPPLDQTAPVQWQQQRSSIPMTAPVVDMAETAPPPARTRMARPLAEPYPLAEPPRAAPPRAVPLAPPPRSGPKPVPGSAPLPEKPAEPPRQPKNGGAWFNAVLLVVTFLAAAAVAAYALARPFLPPSWLP